MPTKKEMEEIDRIVDDVIKGPEIAEAVKTALHKGLEPEEKAKVPLQAVTDENDEEDDDEGDDLWENLPI